MSFSGNLFRRSKRAFNKYGAAVNEILIVLRTLLTTAYTTGNTFINDSRW